MQQTWKRKTEGNYLISDPINKDLAQVLFKISLWTLKCAWNGEWGQNGTLMIHISTTPLGGKIDTISKKKKERKIQIYNKNLLI